MFTDFSESELKEDLVIIQFKLVNKASFKTANTVSFINVPLAKQGDNNINTLLEIMKKFRKQHKPPQPGKKKQAQLKTDFMPFNKSILTRVLAQQLQK
jgi:hypothetical protein